MSHIPYILRKMTDTDEAFVYNSFLRSYHDHYPMKFIPDTLYFRPQTDIIDFLLDTAECLIACFPEDPDAIIGWILHQRVSDAEVIHYMYIKTQHRHKGMAVDIVQKIIGDSKLIIASHICDNYAKLKYKIKDVSVIYDPFVIEKLRELDVTG